MNNNKAKIGAVNNAITEKTNNTYTIWAVSYMMEMATQAAQIFQGAYGCNFVVEEITMDAIDYRLANYSDISELPDLLLIHDSYLQKYIRKYPHLFFTLEGVLDFGVYTNAKVMNISLYCVPYGCPCVCEPVALYYNKDFADNYGSSFNPSVNKSQTLLKYIVKQAGLGGLSQIASDTAGTVVNTLFDILTSIIP